MASNSTSNRPSVKNNGGFPRVKHEVGANQATFSLNEETVLIWRRALLIKYFQELGNNYNTNVNWGDFDNKSSSITIDDE